MFESLHAKISSLIHYHREKDPKKDAEATVDDDGSSGNWDYRIVFKRAEVFIVFQGWSLWSAESHSSTHLSSLCRVFLWHNQGVAIGDILTSDPFLEAYLGPVEDLQTLSFM
jgi:hypothetical protein